MSGNGFLQILASPLDPTGGLPSPRLPGLHGYSLLPHPKNENSRLHHWCSSTSKQRTVPLPAWSSSISDYSSDWFHVSACIYLPKLSVVKAHQWIHNTGVICHHQCTTASPTCWKKSFGLVTERRHYNARHMLWCVFIVECGIARFFCTMRVFEVRASSLSPSLPLWQISFLLRPPLLS